MKAAYHMAIEMLEVCRPNAVAILEEAEPNALAYFDFPASHWKLLRANNVQERTNREIKRRSHVVQAFPSDESLERLVGTVMCDQDEAQCGAGRFSAKKITELYDDPGTAEQTIPTPKRQSEWRLVAKRAIEASPKLTDELEAA